MEPQQNWSRLEPAAVRDEEALSIHAAVSWTDDVELLSSQSVQSKDEEESGAGEVSVQHVEEPIYLCNSIDALSCCF